MQHRREDAGFAALLRVSQRVLGGEHPDTLTVWDNLARWTGASGNLASARDQYATLLPVLERVLGVGAPLLLPPGPASPHGPQAGHQT